MSLAISSFLLDPFWQIILAVTVLLSTALTVFLETLPSTYVRRRLRPDSGLSYAVPIQVVVLGDIGRSPRMQYHAISLAKHGAKVELIGYNESEVHPYVFHSSAISIVPIAPTPRTLETSNRLIFLLLAPLKVLWQVASLYYVLGYRAAPAEWMIVQNPPSIPTLAIAQFICYFRNTKLIIDWHNFGYSILALKLGPSHPLVVLSRLYEHLFGRRAAAHFTVSHAMAKVLKRAAGIKALPLHDRPPDHFQPLTSQQRSEFLARLPETKEHAHALNDGQWRLVVSSTSWTADEDFSILLEALVRYSAQTTKRTDLPNILAIITGKGPQKEHYLRRINELNNEKKLSNVEIKTAWLTMEDYASLLGAADLGVSLHTSSSGVDLPMKVVDMFGTGLPVVGWDQFEAWPELVQEEYNGLGFGSSEELARLLSYLFESNGAKLQKLRQGAMKECKRRWDDVWNPVAGRLLDLC